MPILMTIDSFASEPTNELEPPTESADETPDEKSAPSPLVFIGAAFVAGIAVARFIDWRERARAAV